MYESLSVKESPITAARTNRI